MTLAYLDVEHFQWELELEAAPSARAYRHVSYAPPECRRRPMADLQRRVLVLMTVLSIDVEAAAAALAEGCCPVHREYPEPVRSIIRPIVLQRGGDWGWCTNCFLLYRLAPGMLPGRTAIFARQPTLRDQLRP